MTLHDAWTALRHGGNLLSPTALDALPEPDESPRGLADRLRAALVALDHENSKAAAMSALLDIVLEEACGLRGAWQKDNALGAADAEKLFDGTVLKPRRRWTGPDGELVVVFTTPATRIGVGRGKRPAAQVVEYLRRRALPLGLLTNGLQWRFVWADADSLAWAEWEAERWLAADQLTGELEVLRRVLSPASLQRAGADASPLLASIRDTRRGQAKLSGELGERVRRAVETLLRSRQPLIAPAWDDHQATDLYVAACHFVMRLVVTLFAEARELLPVESPVYHRAYGLRALLDQLDRQTQERRRARQMAWPRLLALFRLLHQGSPHPAVMLPTYGGELFRPGDAEGDGVQRALALLEALPEPPDDDVIHRILVLLTRTTQRIREGASWRTVAAPVDFTELTSEYIGILYEGLLDYELHRAGAEPVLFLNLGDQPALPLDRLEAMDDKPLAALVEKAKIKKQSASEEDEGEGEEDADDGAAEGDDAEADDESQDDGASAAAEAGEAIDDARAAARARAIAWGRRAALAGKLVRKPRGRSAEARATWEAQRDAAAEQLVADVKLPGELYLVRWGGTRKGAGTFYTRPQLTLPTVRHTLEPLIHEAAGRGARCVRPPEALLSLTVCDPAMGSGSFLVAALRVLTEAVVASLHAHDRIERVNGQSIVRCDLLPKADRSLPTEGFEERLEAVVRRAVVEHSLYGVDRDPLAVELARVALWVETLDRRLPFTFLDHKVRCGDALLGTWLDRFRDYPLLAWWRQSPDEKWRGVTHEGDVWAKALKEKRKQVVAEQVDRLQGQAPLFSSAVSEGEVKAAIERVRELYRRLRMVPASQPDKRAELWRKQVAPDPALARVREAFDTWCAIWFWPLEELDAAPTPATLLAPSDEARAIVARVREQQRFFHWELEFPDVFREPSAGFDAVVGNPPWETLQPQSKEFFSNHDPLYRAYGKQEALIRQRELFQANARSEHDWLDYVGHFKDRGNFVRYAAEPFGDTEDANGKPEVVLVARRAAETKQLHGKWAAERRKRSGLSDPEHPFRQQGEGKAYTYKMFVEAGHALLRAGGQLGMIAPSGLYTDKGSAELRRLLLERCIWRWLYGFENRNKLFDIDSRFKFCVAIAEKRGRTEAIQAAFMRHDLEDWAEAKGALAYPAERVTTFSPKSLSVLEIRSEKDLTVLTKIYANSVLLGDDGPDGWGIRYAQGDFNMTSDSKLFIPRDKAEAAGYQADEYGRWIGPEGDVLLPLYEGRMIGQFDFSEKGWVSGKGRSAVWREIPWEEKRIEPQYLMRREDYMNARDRDGAPKAVRGLKLGFMDVSSATNTRTTVAALTFDCPHGNKVPILACGDGTSIEDLCAILGSYAYDFSMRARLGGLTLNYFIVEETPLPSNVAGRLKRIAESLSAAHIRFAPAWLSVRDQLEAASWYRRWAITRHERLRLRCMLDAIVAVLYGLDRDDFAWSLKDCDHPKSRLADKAFCRRLDPKGFWRVDKDQDPELRHTVLSLAAFDDLTAAIAAAGDRDAGIQEFCHQNDGDGWMLPQTLCLADLQHTRTVDANVYDDSARVPQSVRSRVGARFLDWQLAQSPEESWAQCERHTRAILGEEEFERQFGARLQAPRPIIGSASITVPAATVKATGTVASVPSQPSLFGPPTAPGPTEPRSMTISSIRLLNFRNWTADHWDKGVALKPITLVLGRNSAGKTSILQPLRLLKQTIEATDAGTHLLLDGTKADGVNLGSFADVVHDHDVKEAMGIGIDLREKGIAVDVTFRQVNERPVIESLIYRVRDERVELTRAANASYQLGSPRFRLPNWDGEKHAHEPKKSYEPGRAVELSDEALTDLGPTLGTAVRNAIVAVKEAFKSFHYLGPLRPPPDRDVTWSQQDQKLLGSTGSETIQALISNATGKDQGALLAKASEWLKRLDLADGIEIAREGKLRYRIDVLRGGRRSNLADVGYGVSQVLPVIVLLHFVPDGSVILCEGPEAHLHPMAQSGLADLFVEVGKKRKLQVLIETHSEHLFRRLQVLMAGAKVSEHDCALYYVERDEPYAKLTALQADEFGRIQNWPENLFGDAVGEAGQQMREMVKRLQATEGKS